MTLENIFLDMGFPVGTQTASALSNKEKQTAFPKTERKNTFPAPPPPLK